MSYFAGFIATLPWLAKPLLHHSFFKRFLLPHKGDGSGTARVMNVCVLPKEIDLMLIDFPVSRPDSREPS